jgi:LacI family transcriptional regulator
MGRPSSGAPRSAIEDLPQKPSPRPAVPPRPRRVLFVTDFYNEELLVGAVEHAREANWELLANMRFHGLFPNEKTADGILATIIGSRVYRWVRAWKNIPVVQVIASPLKPPYPGVELDYTAAGTVGARHLMELGYVHYAFYWLEYGPETGDGLSGFERELAQAGLRPHRLDFPAAHPGRTVDEVPRETRIAWLASELLRLPKPLAVMGDDDRRALELLAACDRSGLRVPDDVAILGCENRAIELGMARIPISSVDMNHRRVGREAAQLLDRLMQGEAPPAAPIKVPPLGVVARRSTATFVSDSPGITATLLHVREHFHEALRLPALARLAGMSERVFESEFKRCVGRSPRAEIQRARLACAARLLRETDLKLDAIAIESGFGSAKRLCAVFAETHQLTPTVWRQRSRHT